jgi:hypothetical protein
LSSAGEAFPVFDSGRGKMRKTWKRVATFAMAGALAATTLVAVSAPANAACVSDRGYQYVINTTKPHGLILDGFGKPTITHNGTLDNETLSLAQGSTGTSEWSVNASVSGTAGFSFAVVDASVTATIGGSYTNSNSETQTVTVTITIRPKYYGILQGGVFRRVTTGHYFFDNGNCTYTTGSTITTKVPVTSDGSASATNTTGVVPWDQNNAG